MNLGIDFTENTFQILSVIFNHSYFEGSRPRNLNTYSKPDYKWVLKGCYSIYIPKVLVIVIS